MVYGGVSREVYSKGYLRLVTCCWSFYLRSSLENRSYPELKWPNDVFIAGQKLAGVLIETCFQGSELQGVKIGIGINTVSHPGLKELNGIALDELIEGDFITKTFCYLSFYLT